MKAPSKKNSAWLSTEVDKMMLLKKQGYSSDYIAAQLKRTAAAVAVRHGVEMRKIAAMIPEPKVKIKVVEREIKPPSWHMPAVFAAGLAIGLLAVFL